MQYFSDFFQYLSANFLHGFAVRMDDDIRGGFVFSPAAVHEPPHEVNAFVVLQERSAVVLLEAIENGMRISCQKNDAADFLHLHDVALAHGNASAAGEYHAFAGLHFDEKGSLMVAEVLLAVSVKDLGDAHAFPLRDDLIHLDDVHIVLCVEIVGYGGLAGPHEADQDQIAGNGGVFLNGNVCRCHLLYSFKSLIERVDNKPNPAKVQQKSSHRG